MPPRKPSAISHHQTEINLTSSLANRGAIWFSPHACCADRRIHRASPYGCVCVCVCVSPSQPCMLLQGLNHHPFSLCVKPYSRGLAVSTGAAGWRNDAKWLPSSPPRPAHPWAPIRRRKTASSSKLNPNRPGTFAMPHRVSTLWPASNHGRRELSLGIQDSGVVPKWR
jgi:hypothetical protein